MTSTFAISRTDGKTASQVICDLVANARPGQTLEYDAISAALSDGSDKAYTLRETQAAVRRAERQLAIRHNRALLNVTRLGYKVAMASEHQMIAGRKRDRSAKLLKRGLMLLQHVDWDAMSPNERLAHEGHLMVMGALHSTMQGIEKRLSRVEDAIRSARTNSAD